MNIFKTLSYHSLKVQAAFVTGFITCSWAGDAFAQTGVVTTGSGNVTFSTIARNINNSIAELPGLISGVSYMLGLLMGVLGILKIKDHVENPTQTPMKEGAIRLVTGGALFGLPVVFESMLNTIGTTGTLVETPELNAAKFQVK